MIFHSPMWHAPLFLHTFILNLTILKVLFQSSLIRAFRSFTSFNSSLLLHDSTCLQIKNYLTTTSISFLIILWVFFLSSSIGLLFDFFKEIAIFLGTKETFGAYVWKFRKLKRYKFWFEVVSGTLKDSKGVPRIHIILFWLEIVKKKCHWHI